MRVFSSFWDLRAIPNIVHKALEKCETTVAPILNIRWNCVYILKLSDFDDLAWDIIGTPFTTEGWFHTQPGISVLVHALRIQDHTLIDHFAVTSHVGR